jgi:hypothetical protein
MDRKPGLRVDTTENKPQHGIETNIVLFRMQTDTVHFRQRLVCLATYR